MAKKSLPSKEMKKFGREQTKGRGQQRRQVLHPKKKGGTEGQRIEARGEK